MPASSSEGGAARGLPDRLVRIGLTEALAAEALRCTDPNADPNHGRDAGPNAGRNADPRADPDRDPWAGLARITAVHREAVTLHDGLAERPGRVPQSLLRAWDAAGEPVAVGDWVRVRRSDGDRDGDGDGDGDGTHWLQARLPARTRLVRRDGDGRRHTVAANVDLALLVMGLHDDWTLRRHARNPALAASSRLDALVVLTKLDVASADPAMLEARLASLGRRLHDVNAIAVDGTDPATAGRLAPALLPGRTLVLLGSSGAGKSTLANTLLGRAVQDTGPVRAHDSRGMHTTTARTLHLLPGGACIIDTPGVRTLRVDGDADGVQAVEASFADIAALAVQCRFRDCTHDGEPGCAVREHVDADRLVNYRKLLREVGRDRQTWIERRQQLAVWKARSKASRERMRLKRES